MSQLMSAMDLDVYPQIALVIFVGVFVLVMFRLLGRSMRAELERGATLPLEDDRDGATQPVARSTAAGAGGQP
ncbi:MAG: hypothetical protein SFZ23_00325 [Planctomycetota bacterium]|nr:hypothetical protein [Planctomycetota bacterium]